MLARAAWLAVSALLLTATPTLSVEGFTTLLHAAPPLVLDQGLAVPAPVPLPVAPGLGVHAQLAPRLRADVTISVLGADREAASAPTGVVAGRTVGLGSKPALNAPSQVAAVVAEQLRAERDGDVPFTLAGVDDALGPWRDVEHDRLLVGRGQLIVTDAHGQEVRCGLTAAALFTTWGEHVRMAVRAVDPNPACAPLSSSAPRGLLVPDGAGWSSTIHGAHGQEQVVRTGQGEERVPLDYRVTLADGTTFTFHGVLDALPAGAA